MNKSDLIHDELVLYQDILNYQLTGLASPELQYSKQQIQQLNKKCDKLYTDYLIQLEKEKQAKEATESCNEKEYNYIWLLVGLAYVLTITMLVIFSD